MDKKGKIIWYKKIYTKTRYEHKKPKNLGQTNLKLLPPIKGQKNMF